MFALDLDWYHTCQVIPAWELQQAEPLEFVLVAHTYPMIRQDSTPIAIVSPTHVSGCGVQRAHVEWSGKLDITMTCKKLHFKAICLRAPDLFAGMKTSM